MRDERPPILCVHLVLLIFLLVTFYGIFSFAGSLSEKVTGDAQSEWREDVKHN